MLKVLLINAAEPTSAKDKVDSDFFLAWIEGASDREIAEELERLWNDRADTLILLEDSTEITKDYNKLLDKQKKQYNPIFGISANVGVMGNTELNFNVYAGIDLYLFYYKYFFFFTGVDYVFYEHSGWNTEIGVGFKFSP